MMQAAGCKVALVKSDRDNRYSATHISTHDGLERSCHAVAALSDVRAALGPAYEETEVIAIDEAQFFPDLLQFCAQAADYERKQVVVAGLDGDFKRNSFGQASPFFCRHHNMLCTGTHDKYASVSSPVSWWMLLLSTKNLNPALP